MSNIKLFSENELENIIGSNFLEAMPEHKKMMDRYDDARPGIVENKSFFGKTQSQAMDNILTIHQHTPLRQIRQAYAELNKCEAAMRDNINNIRIDRAKFEKKKHEANKDCKYEMAVIEAEAIKIENSLREAEPYFGGSIRKIDNYLTQIELLSKSSGYWDDQLKRPVYTEKDFEREETAHHIMTAFHQALNDWHALGRIGAGNTGYLSQIGISEVDGIREIQIYTKEERGEELRQMSELKEAGILSPSDAEKLVKLGPSRRSDFLKRMAEKYSGHLEELVSIKGRTLYNEGSMVTQGDQRLQLEN